MKSNKPSLIKPTRRNFMIASGTGALLASAPLSLRRAFAAERLVVADPGGPFEQAYGAAFYRPFEEATGNEIANVAREHQPTSQVRAIVETQSYTWDVVTVTQADQELLGPLDLLEPLDIEDEAFANIIPEAKSPYWMGVDVYSTVLCYRRDTFDGEGPQSWADFWDTKRFPGRRSLRRSPIDTLEIALLADGVSPGELYPLDLDRAFSKLDEIRSDVDIWWTGGAQTSQLLQSGEVDMIATWNGRAQTVIDSGVPVGIQWNQGLYSIEGWSIPKGNPKAELGKEFIRFCADAERQAAFTPLLAYGPTNLGAYDYISEERAQFLPTAPDKFDRMILADQKWWGDHKDEAEERFNQWLLS